MIRPTAKTGFTLIEVAIVVVIISLLVGGIVVGRSMIRTSELQAVASEYARYTQAIGAFQTKYQSLPGDFTGATAIWGVQNATPSVCIVTASSNKLTCNGDGNGRITNQDAVNYALTYFEQFRAWQHLGNAELIAGIYTGSSTSGTYNYTIGTNIPQSQYSGAGWRLITYTEQDRLASIVGLPVTPAGDIPANLVLWFGGRYFEATNRMSTIISANDSLDLDTKIDDGRPETGKVLAQTEVVLPIACYNNQGYIKSSSLSCALVFKTGL